MAWYGSTRSFTWVMHSRIRRRRSFATVGGASLRARARSRSIRSATLWKVPASMGSRMSSRRRRRFNSLAASRVNVSASTWRGRAEPVSTR
jgi:hypothetical protein